MEKNPFEEAGGTGDKGVTSEKSRATDSAEGGNIPCGCDDESGHNSDILIPRVEFDDNKEALRCFMMEESTKRLTDDPEKGFISRRLKDNKDYELEIIKQQDQEDRYYIGGQGWIDYAMDEELEPRYGVHFFKRDGKIVMSAMPPDPISENEVCMRVWETLRVRPLFA